ncbi:DIRP domain-containing protein [Naegleria gruberi]|uniref:DIRP domain-containing protein n=1 Tax=Naegleria gruberi TaxID=5762 RepID=D2V5S3_NAEGR|nr:DIRP domain-containing protein [Naegleria gruberi]EFC47702.1 DIRP domain-containing protein [Naegleria gruberi]|eukprot:XP_002680446.1 DIRP domain-containing protein [Naegleria gruberi strain NEG-M]
MSSSSSSTSSAAQQQLQQQEQQYNEQGEDFPSLFIRAASFSSSSESDDIIPNHQQHTTQPIKTYESKINYEHQMVIDNEESELNLSPRRSSRKKTPKKQFSPTHKEQSDKKTTPSKIQIPPSPIQSQVIQHDYPFGEPWTQEELSTFLEGFNKYKTDWGMIKPLLPSRSVSMINSLYETHKRFIEADCGLDVKKLQFHDIHLDYISFKQQQMIPSPQPQQFQQLPPQPIPPRAKNSARKRLQDEFDAISSPKKKGSPRQRFSKTSKIIPTTSNSNTLIPNFKRKQKIIMEQLPLEVIESFQSDSDTVTLTSSQSSLSVSNTESQPTSPPPPQSLQSPLSPTSDLSSFTAAIGMLSPDSKKNYEKNKMLPIKLRKKGTHGNPLLKYIQIANGDQNDTELLESAQNAGMKIVKILSRKKTRTFCSSEWFYPTIDFGFFEKNEFLECLSCLDEPYRNRKSFKKSELKGLRAEMCKKFGKPRRFSQAYLKQERAKLEMNRSFAREYYQKFKQVYQLSQDNQPFVPPPVIMDYPLVSELQFIERLAAPFKKNDQVLVLNPETQHVQLATIMDDIPHSKTDYRVKFLYTKEERIVQDTEIMQLGTVSVLPVQRRVPEMFRPVIQDGILPPQTPPRKSNYSFLSGDNNLNNSMLSASSPHSPFFSNNHPIFQSPPSSANDIHDNGASLQTPTKKQKLDGGLMSPSNIFASPNMESHEFSNPLSSPQHGFAQNQPPPVMATGIVDLSNPSQEVVRNISKCIFLLRKKHEHMVLFKNLNEKARHAMMKHSLAMASSNTSEEGSSSSVTPIIFQKSFCIEYTKLVLDLSKINNELEVLLPQVRSYSSTPNYATTNYPIHSIFSQSITKQSTFLFQKQTNGPARQQMCQDIFESNRNHAKDIVNCVMAQLLTQLPSTTSENVTSSLAADSEEINYAANTSTSHLTTTHRSGSGSDSDSEFLPSSKPQIPPSNKNIFNPPSSISSEKPPLHYVHKHYHHYTDTSQNSKLSGASQSLRSSVSTSTSSSSKIHQTNIDSISSSSLSSSSRRMGQGVAPPSSTLSSTILTNTTAASPPMQHDSKAILSALQSLQEKIKTLQTRVDELEREKVEQRHRYEQELFSLKMKLESERDSYKEQLDITRTECKRYSDKLTETEKELTQCKDSRREISTNNSKSQQRTLELERKSNTLETELLDLKENHSRLNNLYEQSLNKIEELQSNLVKYHRRKERLEVEKKELDTALKEMIDLHQQFVNQTLGEQTTQNHMSSSQHIHHQQQQYVSNNHHNHVHNSNTIKSSPMVQQPAIIPQQTISPPPRSSSPTMDKKKKKLASLARPKSAGVLQPTISSSRKKRREQTSKRMTAVHYSTNQIPVSSSAQQQLQQPYVNQSATNIISKLSLNKNLHERLKKSNNNTAPPFLPNSFNSNSRTFHAAGQAQNLLSTTVGIGKKESTNYYGANEHAQDREHIQVLREVDAFNSGEEIRDCIAQLEEEYLQSQEQYKLYLSKLSEPEVNIDFVKEQLKYLTESMDRKNKQLNTLKTYHLSVCERIRDATSPPKIRGSEKRVQALRLFNDLRKLQQQGTVANHC